MKLPIGYQASGIACGLKKSKAKDFGIIFSEKPAVFAGTFTQNTACAECVHDNRRTLQSGHAIRAIIVNSGNANACTGVHAREAIDALKGHYAGQLGINPAEILTASTGIISVQLPYTDIIASSPQALSAMGDTYVDFADSILTTDTFPKSISIKLGQKSSIVGVAKGAGMIHPNMATMLGFFVTDADIPADMLQEALSHAVSKSFNQISVDGDTSTNDMVLMLANGASGETVSMEELQSALDEVCIYLAKQIIKDGEGATKTIEINISGAKTEAEAIAMSRGISRSMLLKSAIFGNDPNWGRVLAAAGQYGTVDIPNASISLLGVTLLANGVMQSHDAVALHESMKNTDYIVIDVNVSGKEGASSTAWGCDLSYDYVTINAEYHV